MEYSELVLKRHSYRGEFTDEKIPREKLTRIMQAAMCAPSGCNKQTTEFVVVDDDPTLSKMRDIIEMPAVKTAAAFIVCIINKEAKPVYQDLSFEIEDCAAAVQSLLLAITDSGYGSVWLDGQLRCDSNAEKIAKILEIPDNKKVEILLPLGVAAEEKQSPPKKKIEERVSWNSYGEQS